MARDDPPEALSARVLGNGRLSVPVDIRERAGWSPGEMLFVEQTDNGIVLRSRAQYARSMQAMVRAYLKGQPGSSVDDFLAEKRVWAAEEDAE